MKIRQNSTQNLGKSQYFIIFRQYFLQLFDFFRVKPRLEAESLWSGLNAVPCGSRPLQKSLVGIHFNRENESSMKASKIGGARVRIKQRLETQSHRSRLNAVPCGSRFPKKSFVGMHPTVRTDAPTKASKIGVAKVRDKPRLETKSLRSGLGTVLCESRFPKKR